jgi:hypothetical protein
VLLSQCVLSPVDLVFHTPVQDQIFKKTPRLKSISQWSISQRENVLLGVHEDRPNSGKMASSTTTTTTTNLTKSLSPSSTTISSVSKPTALSLDIPPPRYVASPSSIAGHRDAQKPSPHRTFSDPNPSPLRQFSSIIGKSVESPKSAGHKPKSPKNVKFGRGDGMSLEKSPTTPTSATRKDMVKRRHSTEPRMNVHTECGRHSDDWLFGGFSVAGVVKKIWDKKE